MLAFILRSPTNPESALYAIAGRTLLERQLGWLYDSGVDEVFLELGAESIDVDIMRWLQRSPLGLRVRPVQAGASLNELEALATAAGVTTEGPVVSLVSSTIARVDLSQYFGSAVDGGVRLELVSAGLGLAAAEVVISRIGQHPTRVLEAEGWGAQLKTPADAMVISSALLKCGGKLGDFSISIPGTERSPGVWVARGARISSDAVLRAPLYVGYGSWIRAGATVGPNCQIGENVVVMHDAKTTNLVVPNDAIVDHTGVHLVRAQDARSSRGAMTLALLLPLLATLEVARRLKGVLWG